MRGYRARYGTAEDLEVLVECGVAAGAHDKTDGRNVVLHKVDFERLFTLPHDMSIAETGSSMQSTG
jgi:hypothetical protein